MNRIIMIAAALLALMSVAEARTHRAVPVDSNNFLAGVVSINVTMHRIGHHHKAKHRRHKSHVPAAPVTATSWVGNGLVDRARSYMGQTAAQIGLRRTLWCSAFMRHITGASGVDDRAISWNSKPHVAAAVGTIAVMRHHVGIVSGFDVRGNPIIVSGNHGRHVREAIYPRVRILAFVSPS